jgi:hypothetical protein
MDHPYAKRQPQQPCAQPRPRRTCHRPLWRAAPHTAETSHDPRHWRERPARQWPGVGIHVPALFPRKRDPPVGAPRGPEGPPLRKIAACEWARGPIADGHDAAEVSCRDRRCVPLRSGGAACHWKGSPPADLSRGGAPRVILGSPHGACRAAPLRSSRPGPRSMTARLCQSLRGCPSRWAGGRPGP